MKIARRGQGATFPGAALVRPKEHHAAIFRAAANSSNVVCPSETKVAQ